MGRLKVGTGKYHQPPTPRKARTKCNRPPEPAVLYPPPRLIACANGKIGAGSLAGSIGDGEGFRLPLGVFGLSLGVIELSLEVLELSLGVDAWEVVADSLGNMKVLACIMLPDVPDEEDSGSTLEL